MEVSTLTIVFIVALLLWILGLVLSWGAWIWLFFVICLIAGGVIILKRTGKKSAQRFGSRRRR